MLDEMVTVMIITIIIMPVVLMFYYNHIISYVVEGSIRISEIFFSLTSWSFYNTFDMISLHAAV